jgi:hypothetical protein
MAGFTTITWTNTSGGDWTDSSWSSGDNSPPGIDNGALFNGTATYTVTLSASDPAQSIATDAGLGGPAHTGLVINDPNATIQINGSLTVGVGGARGQTLVQSGTLNVGSTGSLTLNANLMQSGGTIVSTGSIALLDPAGEFSQTGGVLDVSGGTFRNAGALSQNGGSILVTGGTLDLQGSVVGDADISLGAPGDHGTVVWDTTASTSTTTNGLTLDELLLGDTLDVAYNSGLDTYTSLAYNNGTLTVYGTVDAGGATITLGTFQVTDSASLISGGYTSGDFSAQLITNNGTSYVEILGEQPCFLRGTRIATLRGEVAVEDLRIGDLVVTTGGALPVKWIGTRGFVARMVNEHHRAALLPIRIAAGALGEASPARDLYVSPEHMLCLDDVLIPAEKLLNGTTISRAENFDVVQYFHIELPRHAVLYAEGAPAESFLDTGNRNMFANVLSYLELGHDLAAPPQPACLPIVTGGETLAAVRARLAARAARAGLATTQDDGLHLLVDGAVLDPGRRDGETVRFTVPAGARQVRIVSHGVVPADLDPANGDRRRLGICLAGLSLRDGSFSLDLAPGHAGLASGFHAAEDGHRWTDGNAELPEDMIAAMPDGFVLELKLVQTALRYAAPAPVGVIPFAPRRVAARLTGRLSA